MPRLNAEQVAALQAIQARRDLARLASALASVLPALAARAGDRWDGLIAEGARRGAAHGLSEAACLGRYLACGFVLGVDFEHRREYAWARELLAATDRPQGGRVFQLCRHARAELARPAPPAPVPAPASAPAFAADAGTVDPEAFDRMLATLDAALRPCGTLGAPPPASPGALDLARACDLDAIELRLEERPAGAPLQRYQLQADARWHRLPTTRPRATLTVTAGASPPSQAPSRPVPVAAGSPGLPARLNVVSQATERGHARLRVRTRASHCCDPRVHPRVSFDAPHGPTSWHGAHAAEVLIDLPADPDAPVDRDDPQPAIGRETAPRWGILHVAGCGLRDAGPALGEQRARVAVYPGAQHWAAWHREPGAALAWAATGTPPIATPAMRCRVERDGLPRDAARWLAGLRDLDRQLREGLARLGAAWAGADETSGMSEARLRCEPTVMSGAAALTWGWTEGGEALTDPPCHRLAGSIDLVVCRLGLRLAGTLVVQGAAGRIDLHCVDPAPLRVRFDRQPTDDDLPALLRTARIAFRQSFVLSYEALAPRADGVMLEPAGAITGALVGAGGLRARADGAGWQWFCELALEPVTLALRWNDPLLGGQTLTRPLLPALSLLDWSLG